MTQAERTKENMLAAAAAMQDFIDGNLTYAGLEEALGINRKSAHYVLNDEGRTYVRKTALSIFDMIGLLESLRTPGERLLDAVFDAGARGARGNSPVRPAVYPEFDEELLWSEAGKALPARAFGIIELRFGRDGDGPMTLQEIAERHGISVQRIQQIIAESFKELRKPCFLKAIFPGMIAQAPLVPAGTGDGADAEALRGEISGLKAECGMLQEENASLRNRLALAAGIIGAPPPENAAPDGGRPIDTRFASMIREGTMPKKLRRPLSLSRYGDLRELAAASAGDIAKIPRAGHDRMLEIADLIEDVLGIRRDDVRKLAMEMKARDESHPSNQRRAAERAGRKAGTGSKS